MPVSVQIKGLDKVEKLLDKMSARQKSDKPVMKKIAVMGEKDVVDHFIKGRGPTGTWKPLKHPRIRGGYGKPLNDTGRLKGNNKSRSYNHMAIVFNDMKYAGVHNDGRSIPARQAKPGKPMVFLTNRGWVSTYFAKGFQMPQRKFMWIAPMTRFRMAQQYLKYIIWG